MDDYGLGYENGREDAYRDVRDTLALPVSDAEKLRLIALQVAGGTVVQTESAAPSPDEG